MTETLRQFLQGTVVFALIGVVYGILDLIARAIERYRRPR